MEEKNSTGLSVLRGVCIAIGFLIVSSMTSFIIKYMAVSGNLGMRDWENYLIYIFCSAASLLIFNSMALSFAYADRREMKKFLNRSKKEVRFFAEMKYIFTSENLLPELLSTHIIIAVLAALGVFPHIGGMFAEKMPTSGWFPALVLTPICFIISVLAKYEAARYYYKLHSENNTDKNTLFWFATRLAIIFILYPIALPFSPALIYAIISVFAVFAEISALLTAVGSILAVILLILLLWGIKVLGGRAKRKRFLSRLKREAAENGYQLSEIKNSLRSFVNSKDQCSFTLMKDEKKFDCIVISTLWRGVPLVFTSPTDAYFLHRIGTKENGITLKHNIEFFHTGEGDKMIIVNPTPRQVLVEENGNSKRVYCADRIWKAAVHDADSFIGCMQRDCLDKNSNIGE